ncbi:M48 family metallopeptidase [Primorskyibacter sp. S87]|uniref:M48 family metallopeptidase n=1 Tax=Primorskyibacter sp. S87 TaxID=3415126 RepID=UPI003C7E3A74
MAEHNLPGRPPVPLTLRRSPRARRISLRVSRLDGRVTLTLPRGVPEGEALAFARDKEAWIRDNLAAAPERLQVDIGGLLPIGGELRRIEPGAGRRVVLHPDRIEVPKEAAPRRLQSFLRVLARDRLAAASDHYAAALGVNYSRLTLRDTRSRWGSCSSQGALMYSWRLILAPPDVLRYVAAHEVAHLREMNHSPAFWNLVEQLYGDYGPPRKWLRVEGSSLHQFRFGD